MGEAPVTLIWPPMDEWERFSKSMKLELTTSWGRSRWRWRATACSADISYSQHSTSVIMWAFCMFILFEIHGDQLWHVCHVTNPTWPEWHHKTLIFIFRRVSNAMFNVIGKCRLENRSKVSHFLHGQKTVCSDSVTGHWTPAIILHNLFVQNHFYQLSLSPSCQ